MIEGDVAVAGHDRGDRVADVNHERATADGSPVDVARLDAEVLGDLVGDRAGAEQAINIGQRHAGVVERVLGRLGVQGEPGHVRHLAQVVGLGGADDRDLVSNLIHESSPFQTVCWLAERRGSQDPHPRPLP